MASDDSTTTTGAVRTTQSNVEEQQRVGVISAATLGMIGIGVAYLAVYLWMGIPTLVWTVALGLGLAVAVLLVLRATGWTTLCANLELTILFGILLKLGFLSGGLSSTNFSWFVVIPVLAAFIIGLRAAWIWLLVVWLAIFVFWYLGPTPSSDLVPADLRDLHSLQDRLGVSLTLILVTTLFIRALRLVRSRLSETNHSLGREIDSRRQAERALRQSEQNYRDLVENSPTMIYSHDLEGTLLTANGAVAEFLGSEDPAQLVGSDCTEFLLPSDSRVVAEYLQKLRDEGEAYGLAQVVTPGGEKKLLEYHNTLRTEGVEEPVVRGLARDVTEEERARRALIRQVEQEELVSEIATRFVSVDSSELGLAMESGLAELGSFAEVDWAGLYLLDRHGDEIVSAYSWCDEEQRVSVPSLEGRSISQFSWVSRRLGDLETIVVSDVGELDQGAADELQELLGPEVRSALLVPLVGRQGFLGMLTLAVCGRCRSWMQEILVLAYIAGYVFASAVLRVRHEERSLRLEREVQQARRMESLGLVAGGIAHDFNNHLMGILGNAGLLRDELAPGTDGWTALQQITDSAHRATQLTSQMLSFSGRANMIPEIVDLDVLLSDVIEQQLPAQPPGVELDLWLSGSLPAVEADAGQIRQVVRAVLLNSFEALEGRTGRVQVRSGLAHLNPETPPSGLRPLKQAPAPGTYAFLQVSDSGCGIESEDLSRIFDPFFSTRFKGRGLGLAAVHGIVRAHKGVIEVSSDPGSGTVMRILLPAARGQQTVGAAIARVSDHESGSSQRGAILVVDDEASVAQVVRRMLELYGFDVWTASNESEIFDVLRDESADLRAVLLDYTLPKSDPRDTLREIRTSGLTAPVILMSGFPREQLIERMGPDQCAGFLEKPFGSEVLLSELQRVLEQ